MLIIEYKASIVKSGQACRKQARMHGEMFTDFKVGEEVEMHLFARFALRKEAKKRRAKLQIQIDRLDKVIDRLEFGRARKRWNARQTERIECN